MMTRAKAKKAEGRALRILTIKEKGRLEGELFRRRKLDNTDFSESNLRDTRFENVSLRGCDFSSADLRGAVFHACDLRDSNFEHSKFGGNCFERTSVFGCRGLSDKELDYLRKCGALSDDASPSDFSRLD